MYSNPPESDEDGSLHSGPGEYLLLLIFYCCNFQSQLCSKYNKALLVPFYGLKSLFMPTWHGELKVGLLTSYC